MDSVGRRIKQARQQKGLSQQALADLTHVSQPTVANWEKGSHAPRHSALGKISHILETSPSWLLGETLYSNPPSDQSAFTTAAPSPAPPSHSSHHTDSAAPAPVYLPANNHPQDTAIGLHHVPVINWPSSLDDIYTSTIENYISLTLTASRPIALTLTPEHVQHFKGTAHLAPGSTLIIDLGNKQPNHDALFLIQAEQKITLQRFNVNTAKAASRDRILGRAILLQQKI